MTERTASCSCGKLRAVCSGEPVRTSMCHCLECQKRTGSAFGIQARFAREQVAVHGEPKQYVRAGDSGIPVTFNFCGDCGCTIFWVHPSLAEFVMVASGNFAEPSFPAPTFSVYNTRRHPWTKMPELTVENLD